jgi:uncharacterized membrane protein YeiB
MNTKENINDFFENQNGDIETPYPGHEERFLKKLRKRKAKRKNIWMPSLIAASLLLCFGLSLLYNQKQQPKKVVLSPQAQETQDYFSSVIRTELTELKKQETPVSKVLIKDALLEMEFLEQDYERLKLEIIKKGENKKIIYAMLTNMQTRISFIRSVLEQVETINNNYHENNI